MRGSKFGYAFNAVKGISLSLFLSLSLSHRLCRRRRFGFSRWLWSRRRCLPRWLASATSISVVLFDGDEPRARWLSTNRKVSGVSMATELSLGGDEALSLSGRFDVSVATELSSTATELSSTAT
ncbi:hypothetical protein DY000_02024178 [Brassica cretica]|uniref:Secreted protein n=1 Tax=Brassica cretica TaxID=69181 RepID=A0ABQ7EBI0_BRACR|nr:hypothetical protein DY000_02024178 [Brassica cretica]